MTSTNNNNKSINMDETLLHICSTNESESKNVIVNACSLDKSESKIVRISVNTSKVKDAMNLKNDEEPSVPDNSVINALRYFKIWMRIRYSVGFIFLPF